MPLPITDAVRLSYLHRHTAARAGVAIAGNYNRLSSFSFHLAAHPIFSPSPGWRAQETD